MSKEEQHTGKPFVPLDLKKMSQAWEEGDVPIDLHQATQIPTEHFYDWNRKRLQEAIFLNLIQGSWDFIQTMCLQLDEGEEHCAIEFFRRMEHAATIATNVLLEEEIHADQPTDPPVSADGAELHDLPDKREEGDRGVPQA
jgi:hypothetical protein